jgi:hypothetical protein
MPLTQLRQHITRKFGKPISSHYDAIQLQEAIVKESGKRLSTQTIKRFFGLIKSSSRPDPATLDALSGYLKFSSYKDFQNWLSLSVTNVDTEEHDWASEIVLQVLKDIHPENLHEKGLLQLVKNLFTLFERHPNLTSTIYPKLAASKFGRRYFFEQFVHYDALASHYGMGLEHFLLHEKDRPARFFGYSMLCLRDFLTGNNQGCKYYYEKVAEYPLNEVNTFHPFLIGRFHSSHLYMDYISGRNSVDYIGGQIHELINNHRHTEDIYDGFPCAELVFAEALVFTGHFQEAYELLNHKKIKEYKHPPFMDEAFKNHLNVLRNFSGLLCGTLSIEKVQKHLPKLEQAPVYFLCSNYDGLFMNLMKTKCNIQPRAALPKAEECLSSLGFNRLQFYLSQ